MGLFTHNRLEKELINFYALEFEKQGIPRPLEFAENLIKEAKKLCKQNPVPPNAGDLILTREKNDEKTHQVLEKKRREGVKDEDIRFWWNLSNLERFTMLKFDEINRIAMFQIYREKGLSVEEANKEVRKAHPFYGDPQDITHSQGDDRPLCEELKERINIYIEKRSKENPEKIKEELRQFSSFNAFIRNEIKAGKI